MNHTDLRIIMNKCIKFYSPYFKSEDDLLHFVNSCEILDGSVNKAKVMMHQTQRLITAGDIMKGTDYDTDAMKLLFYIICTETIAKLYRDMGSRKTKESKSYVYDFFNNWTSENDRDLLTKGFTYKYDKSLHFDEIIELLYQIRCDVVHEGRYWRFHFSQGCNHVINLVPKVEKLRPYSFVSISITIKDFRDVIVRNSIKMITEKLYM